MQRRRVWGGLEILTPFIVAAIFIWSCTHVHVDALDRLGQVSGIAGVELRFVGTAAVLVLALIVAAKRDAYDRVSPFVYAAFAGLASATVAGGLAVILHPTPFGLGAIGGDVGTLAGWADDLNKGKGIGSSVYPPLQIYLLAFLSKISGIRPEYVMKPFQIGAVAAMGPCAYAAWRLIARPGFALVLAVVGSMPLVECYREHPLLVLVILIPVLIKFLEVLRDSGDMALGRTLRLSAGFGLALGGLFLMYSGWFQWSGPGFMVAAAIVFPWRTGWKQGVVFGGIAGVIFIACVYRYVTGVVTGTGVKDSFVYFDALTEPMYIAMWRGGSPGHPGVWPPVGELGGVGLFTAMLAAGFATAVAYGRKHVAVIAMSCMLVGSFLFRLYHAKRMYSTQLVQLWPRTTAEIVYLLLVLTCFGVSFVVGKLRDKAAPDSPLRTPAGMIGLVVAIAMLIASASSATIDRYMPNAEDNTDGHLAYVALKQPRLEVNQLAIGSDVHASSSIETPLWSEGGSIDHTIWRGYASKPQPVDHVETMDFDMHQIRRFSRIYWYPAMEGSPIQLEIGVWDGSKFVKAMTVDNFPQQAMFPQPIKLPEQYVTDKFQIRATKLRKVDGQYQLRVAEIELYE